MQRFDSQTNALNEQCFYLYGSRFNLTSIFQLDRSRKLLQIAEKCLEGGNYFGGIEACNEILDGNGRNIGVILKHDSLCTRAALLLKVRY